MKKWPLRWKVALYSALLAVVATIGGAATTGTVRRDEEVAAFDRPVNADPTDGGIAPDQFLAITFKPDGTPLEPEFLSDFESLRTTGPLGIEIAFPLSRLSLFPVE